MYDGVVEKVGLKFVVLICCENFPISMNVHGSNLSLSDVVRSLLLCFPVRFLST